MPAQDPFELAADARECRARALVSAVRVEADADDLPCLEGVRQHQVLRFGVGAAADRVAGEPRVTDLAGIGCLAAMGRMAGWPGPPVEIEESRGADDYAVAHSPDGERHRAPFFTGLECRLDIRGRVGRPLGNGAP